MRRAGRGRGRDGRGVLLFLCALAASHLFAPCLAHAIGLLEPRAFKNTSLPAPISFAPDQSWEGIDGQWNTFSLLVGEPQQWVRVLVSTASQQTWAVAALPAACASDTDTTCFDSRGGAFNISSSSSWVEQGYYRLWLEQNINLGGNGLFGNDTVTLGLPGQGGPTIHNTIVGTVLSPDFWLGHFGVNPKPTNFSAFSEPSPSLMTYLFQQNLIPGLSFGYTAGNRYRLGTVLASLTLGGYDASRYVQNDLTFYFAPDNERDIVVGVVDIQVNGPTDTNVNLLLRDSFDMYIDTTVAELWLPIEVCRAFEQTFGLEYDNDTSLYLVNDATHANLVARNASITFSLGQKAATNDIVNITLPYAAFDLEARPPYRGLQSASKYFPIRRGNDSKQFILGRTFLQEAYLTVDWERQNFSISQCSWVYRQEQEIVPIVSPRYSSELMPTSGPKRLSTGAITGVAVGCGFTFALLVCGTVGWFWRRRHQRHMERMKAEIAESKATAAKLESSTRNDDTPTSPIADSEEGTNVFPKAELPAGDVPVSADVKERGPLTPLELPSPTAEVEGTERQIFEMLGDLPERQEAGGRQLSEKESMVVRERIYNGVDPSERQEADPPVEVAGRRPPPLSASDVALVNRRLPASPVTPLTPRTPRDGSHLEASDTFFQPPGRTPRDGRFLEADDTLLSPISPLEGPADTNRRRFSYES